MSGMGRNKSWNPNEWVSGVGKIELQIERPKLNLVHFKSNERRGDTWPSIAQRFCDHDHRNFKGKHGCVYRRKNATRHECQNLEGAIMQGECDTGTEMRGKACCSITLWRMWVSITQGECEMSAEARKDSETLKRSVTRWYKRRSPKSEVKLGFQ